MTGNKTVDKIFFMLSAVVTAAALGLFLYAHLGIAPPRLDQQSEFDALKEEEFKAHTQAPIKLNKLVVNLPSRHTRLRYVEIELHVETFIQSQEKIIRDNEAMIYDRVIDIIGKADPAELNSVTGKILFEGKIKNRVNTDLKDDVIKKIYFSKFVIQ